MANALYPLFKQSLLTGLGFSMSGSTTVSAVLVDTTKYNFASTNATDQFYSKITLVGGSVDAHIGAVVALSSTTCTLGVFNAATLDFGNTTGAAAGAVVIFNN